MARHQGGNSANIICALFGSTTPFGLATLWARYGTVERYVEAYTARADAAVAAGIMTPEDRDAALAAVAAVSFDP